MTTRKKLFITGAQGFVGSHAQLAITNPNWQSIFELVCIDIPFDITDRSSLNNVVCQAQPDMVIHLAAQSHVPTSFTDPDTTYQVNFLGTLNLLQALAANNFSGRLLFVGSADTYGLVSETDLPIHEAQPLRPRNPYAVSKVAAEALCYQWSQTGSFEIIMARPFNHIGPGQGENFAVSSFAKQVAEISLNLRAPEIQVGDLNVTRDFTDVRDIVDAYLKLLLSGKSGEIYNVGSGQEHKMSEILAALIRIAGISAKVNIDAERLRPAEQKRLICDASKLKLQTGWQPRKQINETLHEILQYWMGKLKHG
ncbi:MAG: GDP-mannose 4,6-dehydratase [Candidatus Nitrotoga sp.]